MNNHFYRIFVKRILDITFSLIIILIISPIYLILILLQFSFLGRPIFYNQIRIGENSSPFKLYKFRTMKNKVIDKNTKGDINYISTYGKLLRSFSLDELPSLFNILLGNLSFVGPRPLLPEYLPLYSKEQHQRHLVKPGLTGLAQVNGRNYLTWTEKFRYDITYVTNVNFLLDLTIIIKTFWVVIARKGINYSSSQTSEKFNGLN
jgi:lipopolysaccharide/colanic/teichoic acid biosynthesis glycosyltransferase